MSSSPNSRRTARPWKTSMFNQDSRTLWLLVAAGVIVVAVAGPAPARRLCAEPPAESPSPSQSVGSTPTVDEARGRARILHETIHGALQVVHRDFFDEDAVRTLPSQSLEDVFLELERSFGVSIRWISVNAKAMNIDHEPRDEFEKQAAKALAAGKQEYESYEAGDADAPGEYRHAGRIRLASQCLKCHVPNRTSTEDRLAGLTIKMKIASPSN